MARKDAPGVGPKGDRRGRSWAAALLVLGGIALGCGREEAAPGDPLAGWAIEEGYAITRDAEGFRFPTAIAFVPRPGRGPKDPLYFVTEIRGTVKVVTNDRTVHTFAEDFFELVPEEELPRSAGQSGLGGVCLAPEKGYVFVTFAYQDSVGALRNGIARFDSRPETFGLRPTAQRSFVDLLADFPASWSHQIGACQVDGEHLYIGVGDGFQSSMARRPDALLGKILRLTLDGDPAPGNPWAGGAEPSPRDAVWAMGVRNPFGLKVVDGRLFVADNGNEVDRFLEVERGGDYGWDGTDQSAVMSAAAVFAPGIGPVHVDFHPAETPVFPGRHPSTFFVAVSAQYREANPPGVIAMPMDLGPAGEVGRPVPFIQWRGEGKQLIAAVAFGPDGLYVAPLYGGERGLAPILRVTYDPEGAWPNTLGRPSGGPLLSSRGCMSCHVIDGDEGTGQEDVPELDRKDLAERLRQRVESQDYLHSLAALDTLDVEPWRSTRAAREEVRAAEGLERVRVWIVNRLLEPRFDNPAARMPRTVLSREEAESIAEYLLEDDRKVRRREWIPEIVKGRTALEIGGAALLLGLAIGFVAARLFRRPS